MHDFSDASTQPQTPKSHYLQPKVMYAGNARPIHASDMDYESHRGHKNMLNREYSQMGAATALTPADLA